jgi:hypothetical protein
MLTGDPIWTGTDHHGTGISGMRVMTAAVRVRDPTGCRWADVVIEWSGLFEVCDSASARVSPDEGRVGGSPDVLQAAEEPASETERKRERENQGEEENRNFGGRTKSSQRRIDRLVKVSHALRPSLKESLVTNGLLLRLFYWSSSGQPDLFHSDLAGILLARPSLTRKPSACSQMGKLRRYNKPRDTCLLSAVRFQLARSTGGLRSSWPP